MDRARTTSESLREDAAPGILAAGMRPIVRLLETGIRWTKTVDPFRRDPGFIAQTMPLLGLANRYFATEFRGWERLPAHGPFLVVGNHSGGAEQSDFWFFLAKWVAERGPGAPLYALAYDLLFSNPLAAAAFRRLGVVPATRANARRAFAMGSAVLVFPGGDYEVFRPWSERNRIEFGGRLGFVEVALEAGVPVVPMTIHGAHQSTFVLTRGRRLARLLGIDRLHVHVFPLLWSVPFGLAPAFVPSLQLPAKVTVQLGHPLDWSRAGSPDDPAVVRRCYDEITGVMQDALDEMARERPYPVLSRLADLLPLSAGRRPPRAQPASRAAA